VNTDHLPDCERSRTLGRVWFLKVAMCFGCASG